MDFQAVVLAGGPSKKLAPLVSTEVPKPLLPVANRPVLAYVLELLESNNIRDVIVVVKGEDAAVRVDAWVSKFYSERLCVEVAAVPEDVGTAGALRAVEHRLTARDILIVSGDLVTDVHPGSIAATHRRHSAVVTALFCYLPTCGASESGSSAKDKAKKSVRCNIVGLDESRQFLLHIASGADVDKDQKVERRIFQAAGQMEVRMDLMDAHMYAFNRNALQEVLHKKDSFQSIRHDVLPYLVRSQLRRKTVLGSEAPKVDDPGSEAVPSLRDLNFSKHREIEIAESAFTEVLNEGRTDTSEKQGFRCCAYIASKSKYCARLNSVQAFYDINRDVVGEANHLSGYSFSAQNNIIHPSSGLGSKTTVGPQCMLDEGSQLGDKCSVKKSVIGRHCRVGNNVKIVNSVVMDHVTIEDGCSIQSSVICSNVLLQERASMKDCQVGAGYIVTPGSDHKSECLTKS